jgi:hypothetical protein
VQRTSCCAILATIHSDLLFFLIFSFCKGLGLYCLGRRRVQNGQSRNAPGNAKALHHELQTRAHVLGPGRCIDGLAKDSAGFRGFLVKGKCYDTQHHHIATYTSIMLLVEYNSLWLVSAHYHYCQHSSCGLKSRRRRCLYPQMLPWNVKVWFSVCRHVYYRTYGRLSGHSM